MLANISRFARTNSQPQMTELIDGRFAISELLRRNKNQTVLRGVDYSKGMAAVEIHLLTSAQFEKLSAENAEQLINNVFSPIATKNLEGVLKPLYYGLYNLEAIVVYPVSRGKSMAHLMQEKNFRNHASKLMQEIERISLDTQAQKLSHLINPEDVFVVLDNGVISEISISGFGHQMIIDADLSAIETFIPEELAAQAVVEKIRPTRNLGIDLSLALAKASSGATFVNNAAKTLLAKTKTELAKQFRKARPQIESFLVVLCSKTLNLASASLRGLRTIPRIWFARAFFSGSLSAMVVVGYHLVTLA